MKVFDVIKFEGPNNVLVWKFPGEDFNTLSQLIVHESQEAIFFKDGQALDLFGPGSYTMHSQNIPLIRRLVNLPFDGVSPFHCEVYFINRTVSMDVKWGTNSPIPIQDALYKIILPIRAHGQFAVKLADSRKVLVKLVGTINQFDQKTLMEYFRGILLTNIKDYIATELIQKQVSFLEITTYLKEISDGIKEGLVNDFSEYGIDLVNFKVEEISPPEDDPSYIQLKNALAKKAEMSVMGYNYQQQMTFDVLNQAASNEGSSAGLIGAGMGVGMGVNLGSVVGSAMGGAVTNIQTNTSSQAQQPKPKNTCRKCGNELPDGAKFCLECGQKVEDPKSQKMITCPECGASVPEGKFCLECGHKFVATCPKCGAQLVPGAKFCLECGTKIE